MNLESVTNSQTRTCWDLITPRHVSFPFSWVGHIPFAMWLMCEHKPHILVELGTHSGNSYLAMCESVRFHRLPTRCFAVDTWRGDEHAGVYGEDVLAELQRHHDVDYGGFSSLLRMTFDDALGRFEDGSVDLLHIDGLHTYEAVRHDFESWLPKLAPGAIVLFHDIAVCDRDFGVDRYWRELQSRWPHSISFTHSNGLGVLFLQQPKAGHLSSLLDQALPEQFNQNLKTRFQVQGEQLIFHSALQSVSGVLGGYPSQQATLAQLFDAQVHQSNLNRHAFDEYRNKSELLIAGRKVHIADLANDYLCQLKVMEDHAKDVASELASVQHQLQVCQARYTEGQSQIEHMRNQVKRLETDHHTLVRVLASRSWKATEPLREIGRRARKLRLVHGIRSIVQGTRSVSAVVRRRGIYGTLSRAAEVFKDDGLSGLHRKAQRRLHPPSTADVASLQDRYSLWIEREERLISTVEAVAHIASLNQTPLISVILPVYNPPLNLLQEAVNSVLMQSYPYWELCVADDASPNAEVRDYLEALSELDSRIKVVLREQNGHISAASNSALALAAGEFVALLDHDDLLAADALLWVVTAINEQPEAQILYSDEDKIDLLGTRTDPYFKPDWNLEIFLSQNVVSHLGVYRRTLIERVKGFRLGYEGSQDHDLALRCLLHIQASQIVHIPRILYHWRVLPGSTSLAVAEKPYAQKAGERALNDYLAESGLGGYAKALPHGGYKVMAPMPIEEPTVTVIIPTRNAATLVETCITSILNRTNYKNYDILLIDNGSDDPLALSLFKRLSLNPKVRVLRDDRPFNYSALNNMAVAQAKGDFVCLLNNDVEVISPAWLGEMVSLALRPGVGAVGARLWYPDETLQHGGVIIGLGGVAGHAHHRISRESAGYFGRGAITQCFSAVTGACLLVRKSLYQRVGGLNENDLSVAFNDVDFCLRLQEFGLRNVWTPYAELYHHESVSRGLDDTPEKRRRFQAEVTYMQQRWAKQIDSDPYYSPNLSRDIAYQFQCRE